MKKITLTVLFFLLFVSNFYAKPKELADEDCVVMEAKHFSLGDARQNKWKGVILKNASISFIRGNKLYGQKKKNAYIVGNTYIDNYNGYLFLFETDFEEQLPPWLSAEAALNAPYYTIKINLHPWYDFFDDRESLKFKPEVIKLEGPTYGEILKIEEEKKKREEHEKLAEYEAINSLAKPLAEGYVFHGAEEKEANYKAFKYGTMEKGHAYYISGYVPDEHLYNYMGGVIYSLVESAENKYVSFKDNKAKQEVLEASAFLGGYLPVAVVMTGSDNGVPVIMGVVK